MNFYLPYPSLVMPLSQVTRADISIPTRPAIQETLLVPRIQGKAMGLSPSIILLSLSVWGKLLGFLGLILALPLTCLGLTYYRRYILKYDQP